MDLSQYAGKRVILVRKVEGSDTAEEVEGTVESANQLGIVLKPKGKATFELVEEGNIEDIRFAPVKPQALKAKKLKPVPFGQVKRHLLDRHAFTLSVVNEMTEEKAVEVHDGIDHSDLGHKHAEDSDSENE